jgi:hypothetical protein
MSAPGGSSKSPAQSAARPVDANQQQAGLYSAQQVEQMIQAALARERQQAQVAQPAANSADGQVQRGTVNGDGAETDTDGGDNNDMMEQYQDGNAHTQAELKAAAKCIANEAIALWSFQENKVQCILRRGVTPDWLSTSMLKSTSKAKAAVQLLVDKDLVVLTAESVQQVLSWTDIDITQ